MVSFLFPVTFVAFMVRNLGFFCPVFVELGFLDISFTSKSSPFIIRIMGLPFWFKLTIPYLSLFASSWLIWLSV